MPGPVSDSHDPEFGTGANCADVRAGIESVVSDIKQMLGPELKDIVVVAQSKDTKLLRLRLSERRWRLVRFGLLRALESL
jgi:hypothetical protein